MQNAGRVGSDAAGHCVGLPADGHGRPAAGDPRLEVAAVGLHKSFSGVHVLRDVSVTLRPGEVHSIMGENGAGKSVLLKLLAGYHTPDSGQITVNGSPVTLNSPRAAIAQGIYRVPQEPVIVPDLSVAENLFIGVWPSSASYRRLGLIDRRRMVGLAKDALERVGARCSVHAEAGTISIAQQQVLECARALVHNCRVIYFDEPTSPLTPREVEHLFRVIDNLRAEGYTLAFISHRLHEISEISDRVTVIRDGKVVAEAERADADPTALIEAAIGRPLKESTLSGARAARERAPGTTPLLQVDDLTCEPSFRGISFQVNAGEVLGLAGLVGSGRTELAEAIFGLRPLDRGTVTVEGRTLAELRPRVLVQRGVCYVPEDRAKHGIFARMNVGENAVAGRLNLINWRGTGFLTKYRERLYAYQVIKYMRVHTHGAHQLIERLSGGNQQKVVLGRWLLAKPKVVILDEPTRGIDVGAKEEIHELILKLADEGMGVVVISSELEELVALCDRAIALHDGDCAAELDAAGMSAKALGAAILR